ncbi:hypothetical protein EOA88_16905 [Mesorhizobium sp. M5C.F.Ca.IN.020.14.1.1]|nr:hypothetical protein EOA88_16905 [Mesorhizobium sp. M5C.F.Ca.IN.020.14.1.1]
MTKPMSSLKALTPKTIDQMAITEVIDRIESLNKGIAKFWSMSDGWAPVAAAGLLGKSRLDWQVSLSGSLRLWIREPANALSSAELILAWANLGSLIEGSIKTLLSVWYETYKADIDNLKKVKAFDHSKQAAHSPDGLGLEKLRVYCKTQGLLGANGDALVELVQQRRNAIHAFKDRPIGDGLEFQGAVRGYLALLRNVNARLPYPDDNYVPRER